MPLDFSAWTFQKSSTRSLYEQLVERFAEAIETGELPEGQRLPSERELAEMLGLSRTTVTNAYRELESRGIIRGHVGRGTFVCALPEPEEAPFAWRGKLSAAAHRASNNSMRSLMRDGVAHDVIALACGAPAIECFPSDLFHRIARDLLRRQPSAALGHCPIEGQPALRKAIAGWQNTRPERILILSGSQQGIDLLAKALIDPGDSVVLDRPGFVGALQAFRAAGARIAGWNFRDGSIGELEDLLIHHRPKVIYTNPTFQNPTTHTMPLPTRKEFLKVAARYRTPVIEDLTYQELHYDGAPPPSMASLDEHNIVVQLNTFSKVLSPGLRMGWITASEVIVEHLAQMKLQMDIHSPSLSQLILAELVSSGAFADHLVKLRGEHAARRDAMVAALHTHLGRFLSFEPPRGGAYVWARLHRNVRSGALADRARTAGVTIAPGTLFYHDDCGNYQVRLCFSAAPVNRIEEGVRRLARCVEAAPAAAAAACIPVV